jgi:hypothetical protein
MYLNIMLTFYLGFIPTIFWADIFTEWSKKKYLLNGQSQQKDH